MNPIKDLTGQRFGYLTATKRLGLSRRHTSIWLCVCDCGNTKAISADHLRDGGTRSCGCFNKTSKRRHGMFGTRTYTSWANMLRRCNNTTDKSYPNYGAKGILVCKRWYKFESFLADMGVCPDGLTLDRINNNGNYEPGNCRWATRLVQANNHSRPRFITYKGETHTITGWAKKYGMSNFLLRQRLFREGWTMERALTTPCKRVTPTQTVPGTSR